MKVITATGREIDAYRVIKGGIMDYLHIYINSLTPAEIYSIFDNPNETSTITIVETREDKSVSHTYRGYTELFAVQKPILSSPDGTWMIWMQRPEETTEDIIFDDETEPVQDNSPKEEVISNAE